MQLRDVACGYIYYISAVSVFKCPFIVHAYIFICRYGGYYIGTAAFMPCARAVLSIVLCSLYIRNFRVFGLISQNIG